MQLKAINQITGQIQLITGLHIGAGNEEVHIGGIDNGVIKHPHTQQPYIPGSSLKGKMRSLLEWRAGLVGDSGGKPVSIDLLGKLTGDKKQHAETLIRLFGAAGDTKNDAKAEEIGITRLSFWDCALNESWAKNVRDSNQLYTEAKSENTINRITGTADNPRQTERVPADAIFDFKLGMKILADNEYSFIDTVLAGLKLLELDGIGGSGSRGYGKIKFKLDDADLQARLEAIDPFKAA
ncbi:CRISPR type III-associated RAMP protein Csm3 [Crenothrix polyspora]|uniref:CRISPR system Cms endoribonuclease Csm3 n=1 Tax=Crenothrix polyspora TaxID=360316 RepID=A0A1R4H0Y7_9GAMM|nr:type III-A CRISPR-associated RAMP protein Csm3 [Crenothrix polyspora]SJM89913.1 CRISPR type III-associated RAMP protein Csm3 [Crenothrix polyspora]